MYEYTEIDFRSFANLILFQNLNLNGLVNTLIFIPLQSKYLRVLVIFEESLVSNLPYLVVNLHFYVMQTWRKTLIYSYFVHPTHILSLEYHSLIMFALHLHHKCRNYEPIQSVAQSVYILVFVFERVLCVHFEYERSVYE